MYLFAVEIGGMIGMCGSCFRLERDRSFPGGKAIITTGWEIREERTTRKRTRWDFPPHTPPLPGCRFAEGIAETLKGIRTTTASGLISSINPSHLRAMATLFFFLRFPILAREQRISDRNSARPRNRGEEGERHIRDGGGILGQQHCCLEIGGRSGGNGSVCPAG